MRLLLNPCKGCLHPLDDPDECIECRAKLASEDQAIQSQLSYPELEDYL
ncbi:hypothetical protein KKA15_00085 [Patescibacteria group bacterium]|nr:hypothetical protein [Patescibacteria group bacterium]